MQHSVSDCFTWNATTETPRPRSAPNASTSSCEAPVVTIISCLSQLSVASQTRVASPVAVFLAAPNRSFTPVRNSASKLPLPLLQTASRPCAWQGITMTQKSRNEASANRPYGSRPSARQDTRNGVQLPPELLLCDGLVRILENLAQYMAAHLRRLLNAVDVQDGRSNVIHRGLKPHQ